MQEGQTLINDYQRNRIMAFFNPAAYADSEAYQQLNSVIAIGSGQLWGERAEQQRDRFREKRKFSSGTAD